MRLFSPLLSLLGGLLLAIPLQAQTSQSTYVVGNSYSAQVRWGPTGYPGLVTSAGYTGTVREFTIPGAPLRGLWPSDRFVEDFRTQVWDSITLQCWDGSWEQELEHARFFAEALWGIGPVGIDAEEGDPLGISPNARVYIYAHGLGKAESFDNGDFLGDRTETDRNGLVSLDYFEDMVVQLRTEYPDKEIYVLPAAVVLYEIDKYMEAGLIPGFSDYADLLRDGGHTNDIGSSALALAFFATLWREDPTGLPVPGAYTTDDATYAIFQEITWRVTSRYPLSGVPTGLVVETFALPRGLVDTAYNAQLESWGEVGATTWELAGGALPDGLTLNSDGSITGTPTENGPFVFEAKVTDSDNATDTRQMLMFVDSNNPPVIETTSLPAATRGSPYRTVLSASGGVPGYTWSAPLGDLPHGLRMTTNGEIVGTPYAEPGTYLVTVELLDSNPGTPVSLTQTYNLVVQAPVAGTWFVNRRDEASIMVDGTLDESLWNLEATANHRLKGQPDNATRFGVIPTDDGLYIGVEVTDGNVVNDSTDLAQDDAVHIFLDALHDREVTFNADDRHLVIAADGRFEERNSRPFDIVTAAVLSENGYNVEVYIPWSNLNLTPAGYFSLGLDVGVSDDDDGGDADGFAGWLSATDEDTAPSQFGNLCIWPLLAENLLLNSEMEEGPQYIVEGFNDRFLIAADADSGWRVTAAGLAPFRDIDDLPGGGFPGQSSIAFGTNQSLPGGLVQLLHDERSTRGPGYLTFDVRNPHPAMQVVIWGYNGTPAEVDNKIVLEVRQYPLSPGATDGVLLEGYLPDDLSGWIRYVYPFDAGEGYDYLMFGFAMPTLTGDSDMRIDNIQAGPVGDSLLLAPSTSGGDVTLQLLNGTSAERTEAAPMTFQIVRENLDSPLGLDVLLTSTGTISGDDLADTLPASVRLPARTESIKVSLTPLLDDLLEGQESLTVQVINDATYSIDGSASVTLRLNDHPAYQAAVDEYGILNLAEDDGDGIPWLFEIYGGTRADDPNEVFRQELGVEEDDTAYYLTYTYRFDPALEGIEAVLFSSSNLVDWTEHLLTDEDVELADTTDHTDGTRTVTYRLTVPESTLEGMYLRLGVRAF